MSQFDVREVPSGSSDSGDAAALSPAVHFTQTDMFLLIGFSFLSFWTRHFLLHYPESPVFDEAHFGGFTNHYLAGTYFFDVHPPLAKLILFGLAHVSQYYGDLNFSDPSNYKLIDYISLRQIPAMFATFCGPLLFVAVRCFGLSTLAASTLCLMVICDNSMIVEGRFILTDGILHCFVCLALLATAAVGTQAPWSGWWWFSVAFNGLAAGCAVSCKLTSLSLLPFVGLFHTVRLGLVHYSDGKMAVRWDFLGELAAIGTVIAAVAAIVYFVAFAVHIIVLPYRGSGMEIMPANFRRTVMQKGVAENNWRSRVVNQSLVKNIYALNRVMHYHNMRISGSHPYGSAWYSLPFLTGKWVLFWTQGGGHVMCQGQVFNVYAGTLAVIMYLGMVVGVKWWGVEFWRDWLRGIAFPVGYCCSLFPFATITRTLFFYHYIIPNIFGMLTFVEVIDVLLRRWQRVKAAVLTYAQILTVIAFFFWSVWTYGIPMEDFDIRLWNKKWQR
jgi:dolichyl-phosphate-mannose--protein O-mannosyl transferase